MDPLVRWKKADVKLYLLGEFAKAEKRRKRARSDASRAAAIAQKKLILKMSVDLFGVELDELESQV